MAEEHVSKDQHRADLLELRGELKEEIATHPPGRGCALEERRAFDAAGQ